ncbi:hypothetical protein ILUMI_18654, partial [Ignelater luminosus]
MNVIGIGQGTIDISHKVMLTSYSCCNNYKGTISCLVVSQIFSALPTHTFNRNAIEIPPNIKLADPRFNESRSIDVLLGAADVEKMYRMVWVHPEHRRYQRILWRETTNDEICTYELNTVTYDTTSAPYLTIRCLIQIALDKQDYYRLQSQVIKED